MIVKSNQRVKRKNSDNCFAFEYPLKDKDLNLALVEIQGRYPDKGRVFNESVKELIFVLSGKGTIVVDGKKSDLEKGDCLLILPNQKYFFNGFLKLVVSCNPSWYLEQHRFSD